MTSGVIRTTHRSPYSAMGTVPFIPHYNLMR